MKLRKENTSTSRLLIIFGLNELDTDTFHRSIKLVPVNCRAPFCFVARALDSAAFIYDHHVTLV